MAGRLPYLPSFSIPLPEPWRHGPAQYSRGHPDLPNGWYQDGRKLHNVKSSKAFIWPKDGRKGTKLGRFKDIFQGKGPDMFVTCAADPKDFMANRPSRAQWTRHTHLDGPHQLGFRASKFAPWTEGGMLSGGRSRKEAYDFRTRKYVKRYPRMWTDAVWQSEPYKNREYNTFPEAIRYMDGIWWQDAQHLPANRGGPPENELGEQWFFA
ncbi:uncharacterized protein J4E79_007751 [Alternaria viburni]|uniref:uncharacterized protein n=1 Tax=Alternaria viburni TaxID=566460 RepID=UPI0020C34841|nr:uncharacterized protein J4E79_007751 [Alternaria viburni]KAI4657135.1 hypothetical protein J4E79_007751 [Alternaria viburni]